MSQDRFNELMGVIARSARGKPLSADLAGQLNTAFGPDTPAFAELKSLCAQGEREGWLMAREAGGIKFGRAIKAGGIAGDFSVDVVRMTDMRGPHHIHPLGEIGLVMAIDGAPTFDGFGEGWYVYEPNSEHHPTVAGGDAHVLYFLPEGAIEFTGK